ncbi:hypothetical protein [Flavobacterium sp. T12S277]|uniref:hypothetical protein n=1 Tax=Flavobacterium sp. T12S277 TaxID=3402752 RepID=UPI003AEE7572
MKKMILSSVVLLGTMICFGQTGTVTSVGALSIGTSGTNVTSTVMNSTTAPVITLNIPYASSTATGLVTTGTQIFAGKKTFTTSIFSDPVAILTANTTFYGLAINGKTVGAGKFFELFKGWGTVTGSSLSGITDVGLRISNDISGMPYPSLHLGRDNKQNIWLCSIPAALTDGVSQINSRLQIGYDQWIPDTTNSNTLAVNGTGYFASGIGIGTSNFTDGTDSYKLSVKGKIRAEEIKVYNTWADYVFSKDYKLPDLKEVEKYIIENGHLKNVPSAKEIVENGLELGEMAKIQQEKIEELTLYLVQQNKKNEQLNKDIQELKRQVKILLEKR